MNSRANTKILLVDDEPNILVALEFLINREGYQVYKAQNGDEALDIMQEVTPDIAVLDVMMPGMDGFELARWIRTRPEMEHTRVIFLTAKGTQEDRFKGYANGGEVYLTKPFDNSEVITIINEVLEFG